MADSDGGAAIDLIRDSLGGIRSDLGSMRADLGAIRADLGHKADKRDLDALDRKLDLKADKIDLRDIEDRLNEHGHAIAELKDSERADREVTSALAEQQDRRLAVRQWRIPLLVTAVILMMTAVPGWVVLFR